GPSFNICLATLDGKSLRHWSFPIPVKQGASRVIFWPGPLPTSLNVGFRKTAPRLKWIAVQQEDRYCRRDPASNKTTSLAHLPLFKTKPLSEGNRTTEFEAITAIQSQTRYEVRRRV